MGPGRILWPQPVTWHLDDPAVLSRTTGAQVLNTQPPGKGPPSSSCPTYCQAWPALSCVAHSSAGPAFIGLQKLPAGWPRELFLLDMVSACPVIQSCFPPCPLSGPAPAGDLCPSVHVWPHLSGFLGTPVSQAAWETSTHFCTRLQPSPCSLTRAGEVNT